MAEPMAQAAYEHNGAAIDAARFYAIACDPRRHVAVEACAGAGKTWMLVSRIVRALLEGMHGHAGSVALQPQEILAITFTKRAASEMRERLGKWLREFATANDAELSEELRCRGVVLPADPAAAQRLRERLAGLHRAVLECPQQVQVRTFHSWFATLLRAAPIAVLQQLDLPLRYELLEDDAPAKALVWRHFYRALLARPAHKEAFEAVVRTYGRFQTEKALGVALDKRIEFARADAAGHVDASVRHFHSDYPELSHLATPAHAVRDPLRRARWAAWADALGRETAKTPQKAAQAIADAFALWDASAQDDDAAADCLAALRKALFVEKEDRLNKHLARFDAAQAAAQELEPLCAAQRQHVAWQYQQRMAMLARVLIDVFGELKRERGWIDMTDVERAAITLLSDPLLSGWVQERLDLRIRHLLIDEFQDTNPLQWQALLSWLGSYAGAAGQRPSVFIVGDPKQSIYRFRRAEPQVFQAAQVFVAQGLGGDLLSCDHTRRNAPAVIAAVNRVMLAARDNDQYDGFRAHTTGANGDGQVLRLPPIPRTTSAGARAGAGTGTVAAGDSDAPAWRDSLTQPRAVPEETLRSREARQVALWIARQVAAGRNPAQVMVLSRRRAGQLPLLHELRALRVAAHVGESTALIDCCEVQDIVALLDVLVSPRHDLSLARVLRSPLFDVPDAALVELAQRRAAQPGVCWLELLMQDWPQGHVLHGIGTRLRSWQDGLARLPAHDMLQAIYSQHDVLARYAACAPAVQRAAVLANLRALLSASLQVAGGRFVTPYAFVRALKTGGVMAPATATPNAVRLLTVHGAKGLEAELVVLLDTDTPARATETMGVLIDWPAQDAQPRQFFFVSSEAHPPPCAVATRDHELLQRQREELNALYVALTRARSMLAVSSIEPHRDAGASWWRRLFDVATAVEVSEADSPLQLAASDPAADDGFALRVLPPAPPQDAPAVVPEPAVPTLAAPAQDELARIGQAMHRLLEWGGAKAHQVAAVRRAFKLDTDGAERAAAMARRILSGPGAWAWDPAQLAWQDNEVEVVADGRVLRMDRLVQRREDGQWWVLDHKSKLAPQHDPTLVAQLAQYRAAVQAIEPAQVVRAAFLNGAGEWIELPVSAVVP